MGEGIEIADDKIDRGDGLGDQIGLVVGRGAGQDAGVDGRVQRFDPAAEHLRRAGHRGHVARRQSGRPQRRGRAAAGDQLPVAP